MWELNCAIKVSVSSSPLPKIQQISRQYDQQGKIKNYKNSFNCLKRNWLVRLRRLAVNVYQMCEKFLLKMFHYGNFFPHEEGPGPLYAMDLTEMHISAALNAPELNVSR